MSETGRSVREQREALGWTQELLAKRVGCDVRTVRRLETGARVAPRTIAEVTAALKKARPAVVVETTASGAGSGTGTVTSAPPVATGEELSMTETARDEMVSAPVPPPATMGDLVALFDRDPKAAEQVVLEMMPKPRPSETSEERLTMGYAIVDFLERYQDAQVFVLWDTGDPSERKTLSAFIKTVMAVEKALQSSIFDSAQRFAAQCEFTDHLNALHKRSWRAVGSVTRMWNLEGDSRILPIIAIDQGV